MPHKNAKIDDVKRPGKVVPSPTSRPILVSGQASAPSDPMVVSGSANEAREATQVMTHGPKIIAPLSDIGSEDLKKDSPEAAEAPEEVAAPEVLESKPPAGDKEEKEAPPAPEPEPEEAAEAPKPTGAVLQAGRVAKTKEGEEGTDRDPDAAMSAEEVAAAEAKAKRDEELEGLIASGKYAVPIDAVQRRRSRIRSLILVVLALLLALLLIDAILDAGLVHVPSGVPHTHFFAGH